MPAFTGFYTWSDTLTDRREADSGIFLRMAKLIKMSGY